MVLEVGVRRSRDPNTGPHRTGVSPRLLSYAHPWGSPVPRAPRNIAGVGSQGQYSHARLIIFLVGVVLGR